LTTWAAGQAPVIRPAKASSKPRRKAIKKKDVDVVLLSPRTAQICARKSFVGPVDVERRLGEKRDGGMWDVCKRGLEGELYDEEGGIVFSQELRMEPRESSPDVPLKDVEVVDLDFLSKESSVVAVDVEEQIVIEEVTNITVVETTQDRPPTRRKGTTTKVADNGMPLYSTFTIPQLQVQLPPPSHIIILTQI
jgi:hypothetical protein